MSAYLAFDLGASSGRAILGTLEDGRLEMEELHRFPTPIIEEGERLYWDGEALWQELNEGLKRALQRAPGLRSLSVDSWGVDYVPLDAGHQPLRNAYCYRDPRINGMMKQAFAQVPPEDIYQATGIQFMEINTLYQVLADRSLEPKLFDQTALRLMMADYLHYRFCGRAVAEASLASTAQLMDPYRLTWAEGLMRRFGISPASWPEVVPSATVLGQVPETQVAVVAGCSHDTACAVAAVPATQDEGNWAYLSAGTWSLLGIERDTPLVTAAAREAGFTNEAGLGGTIRLLKNMTGLWVLQECEREWQEAGEVYTYDLLLEEAQATSSDLEVDLDDPRFALRGSMQQRIQDYCSERSGRAPQSRGELVRVILHNLARSHRRTLRQLETLIGERIDVLHIVGGGSRNHLLCQLTADACRCRVVAGPTEATAIGNLLIQAQALGDLPTGRPLRQIIRDSIDLHTYAPRAATR